MNAKELIAMYGSARAALAAYSDRPEDVLNDLNSRLIHPGGKLFIGKQYVDGAGDVFIFTDFGHIVDINSGITGDVQWPLEMR